MKNRNLETLLYSTVGVGAMALLLIGLNIASGTVKQRVDFTAEKAHTLSDGTRRILRELESPVRLRFYFTRAENATADAIMLANYARQVEDLLEEIRRQAGGKVLLERLDPQPDSDAEDSAQLDGIQGQPLPPYGENFYLGLSVSQLDQRVAIPFLSPGRERLLEYDIARAIARVTNPDRPVVGVMSSLPVFGEPPNPFQMQSGARPQEPWVIISQLQRDFEVREVPLSTDAIDEDLDLVVVVHPRGISDETQYALDQFVLRGGKLLAFLDPYSFVDSRNAGANPMQQMQVPGSSLPLLLKAWGLDMDAGQCVSDQVYRTMIAGRNNNPEVAPTVLSLDATALNPDDVLTSQLDDIVLPYAGALTGSPVEGLDQTVLFKTSKQSQLIDRVRAMFESTSPDFQASGTEHPLAVRLTGRFKTAFPEGKPGAPGADESNEAETESTPAEPEGLKESSAESTVVIVTDSDLLFDPVMVQAQSFLGQRFIRPINGNLALFQGMVEQLAGDNRLITVRSRASLNRPFTVVRRMQEEAEASYRSKINELEESLQETERKLSDLQRTKDEGQEFILSPEQQQELEKFRTQQAETRRALKDLRRNLRRDVDGLESRLKWINIAAMPFLVTLTGIGVALYNRKKTAAQ